MVFLGGSFLIMARKRSRLQGVAVFGQRYVLQGVGHTGYDVAFGRNVGRRQRPQRFGQPGVIELNPLLQGVIQLGGRRIGRVQAELHQLGPGSLFNLGRQTNIGTRKAVGLF